MIACTLTLLIATSLPQNRAEIQVTVENQDTYCSIQARDCPVHLLMEQLCKELGGRELLGFEDVEDSPLVSVYLDHRPINQVVDYILGSAGLTGTVTTRAIDVRDELPPFPDGELARDAARIAYLRALRYFPDSPEAPRARMELARIALEQDQPQLAVDHYQLLLEDYPSDPLADDARMRAGRLLVELEDWSGGELHFLEIANREVESKGPEWLLVIAEARRELARCVLMRGEARQALFMLRGLENMIPSVDNADQAIRLFLLARAELELGDHVECLRHLDRAQRVGRGVIGEFEGMDIRARAMELAGQRAEAAMAWLHFSREKSTEVKQKSLVRAAQLALSIEGEELAVLFLHQQAEKEGVGAAVLPYANEARSRLGLEATSYVGGTPSMRLNRAEKLVTVGLPDRAYEVLDGLRLEVVTLTAKERLRFALAFAPLVVEEESVDNAITVMRNVARTLESTENRRPLYRLAGEIYERNGRFDEAAEAYGGQL